MIMREEKKEQNTMKTENLTFCVRKLLITIVLTLSLCSLTSYAGHFSFVGKADRLSPIYKPGETMIFKVQFFSDGKPVGGKKLKWERTGDDQKTEKGEAVSSESEPLLIKTSIDKPGFVRIIVTLCDDNGKPLKNAKNRDIEFEGGAGTGLDKLESYPEPKDFDAFWMKQKAKLAEVPMKFNLVEVPSKDPNFQVFDVKVDCAGGKPVSGYLTKPKNAAPKSLTAQVGFSGYGVKTATPKMDKKRIIFNINAHGIENGKEPEYYNKLGRGELAGKKCIFNNERNSDPETAYFNGMMLRAMRAIEFIKAQPEWDGENLMTSGGSQGGFQALVAAGLDSDVTRCHASKPWCCDLGGVNLGRIKGVFRPGYTDALGYYDPANHAKRIKGEVTLYCGLGDYVCPPSGITVLYNNIKAPKEIKYVQGSTHGYEPPRTKKFILSDK